MARNALASVETEEEAPFGLKADGTPRKRAPVSGPRNRKPLRTVVRVTDTQGNPVPDPRIEVLYVGKADDADAAYTVKEQNPGSVVVRINLPAKDEQE